MKLNMQGSNVSSWWQLFNCLYLSPGYMPVIRRLTGICLLWFGPCICFRSFAVDPYQVPAWRLQTKLIELPTLPQALDVFLWTAFFVSAMWLVCGGKGKILAVVAASVLAYHGCREQLVCHCTPVLLVLLYLIAFIFDRTPVSCSRRLIQITVSCCYLFSAFHKLHPEFLGGYTLEQMFAYQNPAGLRACWVLVFQTLSFNHETLQALSFAVIFVELFLACGLWFKKTRIAAFVVGALLHGSFLVLIEGIDVFFLVMLAGYLSFLEGRKEKDLAKVEVISFLGKGERLLATGFLLLLIWMPLRFFVWTDRPFQVLSFYDRSPWSFAMFLFFETVKDVKVSYRSFTGAWQEVTPTGRMKNASGDNELLALAKYILRVHPDADAVKVESKLVINQHWQQDKQLFYPRNLQRDRIKLQVANKHSNILRQP